MSERLFSQAYPAALKQARYRARLMRLILRLAQAEEEDFVQDLLLHLWIRLQSFDLAKASLPTFCDRVMKNKALTIAEALIADKRDCRLCCVASQILAETADPLPTEVYAAPERADQLDLKLDVARVLESMPPELARVARVLMEDSTGDATRSLQISRATLYRRIEQLRALFTEAGLHSYCTRRASSPQVLESPVSRPVHSCSGSSLLTMVAM